MGDPTYVRDHREPGHFWADNEIIDHYLPAIGIYGFAVYMLLTKFADHKTGQCDPSVEGLARKLDISAPTVRKALEKLKDHGLITIRHRRREKNGKLINQTSIYTLLAVKKPEGYVPGKSPLVGNGIDHPGKGDLVPLVKEIDQGTKGDLPGVLKDVSSNKNHENKNHERESERTLQDSPARTRAVQIYFDSYSGETLDPDQVAEINSTVTDLPRWQEVLRYWKSNGHRAKSVGKMLDRYRSGRTIQDERPPSSNGARAAPDNRPPLPIVQPNPSAVDPAESRRKTAELMRELRGT